MLKRKGRVNFFTTVALQDELLKCSLTFQKFRILGIGTFKRASIHNDSFPVPRFSVIQVCLIVKLAYVAEPQLFKRRGGPTIIEQSKYHGEDIIARLYYSPTSPCQHVSYMDTSATESFPGLGHGESSTNSQLNDLCNRNFLYYGQRTLNDDPSEQIT